MRIKKKQSVYPICYISTEHYFHNIVLTLKTNHDEIRMEYFSLYLNRYDEEFFSHFGRNVKLIKLILMFLSSVVLMNVVEFCKMVTKVFWKYLITEFIHKFSKFDVDLIVYFKTLSLEYSKLAENRVGQKSIALRILF